MEVEKSFQHSYVEIFPTKTLADYQRVCNLCPCFMRKGTIYQTNFNDMKNKSLLLSLTALLLMVGTMVLAMGNPQDDKHNGKNQSTGVLKSGSAVSLNWQSMGPDNVGGRTRAILFDKRDASGNTVYAGSVAGGVWKTTTLGANWVKVNQANANLNVTCLAQTSNNDIYAGTGEYGFTQGTGLYVSTDGDNFTRVPGTEPAMVNSVLEWGYINEIGVQDGRLFVATNAGLKYRNAGETNWQTAMYKDAQGNSAPLSGFVWDVKVGSDGTVVASVDSKVYISSSGSPTEFICVSTKETVGNEIINPEKLPATGLGRIELAIAPSNPSYIYASATDAYGYFDNVYRSTDKGNTWTIIFPGKSTTLPDIYVLSNVAYGFTANTIVVYPDNPDHVLVGGINLWEGIYTNEGFFYWGNAAVTSSSVSKYSPRYLHELHHTYVFKPNDPKVILAGTDGGIYINMDGELQFKSLNRNYMTAQFISVDCNGFGNPIGGTIGNGIQYIGDGTNTPYSGVEVWNGDLNNSGEGGYVAISKINPEVFLLSLKGGPFRRSEDKGYSFSTTFLGSNMSAPANTYCPMLLWENFNDPYSVDSTSFKATKDIAQGEKIIVRSRIYDYPFTMEAPRDIQKGERIYVKDPLQAKTFLALANKVYYTKEILDFTKQPEWWNVATVVGVINCMALSADANHLYVGTETGNVFRISNLRYANSAATADITSTSCVVSTQLIKSFPNASIGSIAVDQKDPKHIIVTLATYGLNDYVFNVTNALDSLPTFVSVQGNLPKAPVYSSLLEMNDGNLAILGTEYGIYTSTDVASGNWVKDSGPMGSVPVKMLKQQITNGGGIFVPSGDPNIPGQYYPALSNYGAIYAATYGRGIYVSEAFVGIPENPGQEVVSKDVIRIYPNPVKDDLLFNLTMERPEGVVAEIYDFSGKVVAREKFDGQQGLNTFGMDASNLPRGTYILRVISGKNLLTGKFVVVR